MNRQFRNSLDLLRKSIQDGGKVYGIFGSPVTHSLSPLMHNRAFMLKNIRACYLPFHVGIRKLKDALHTVRDAGISGLNITLPLKKAVIDYLDDMTPAAGKISSVNTIQFTEGRMKGHNTDAEGFRRPLKNLIEPIRYENVAVFGGGGSARTVLYALLQSCSFPHLTLITRNEHQGNKLLDEAEYWRKHGTILEWADFSDTQRCAEVMWESRLLINCTPLGMTGYGAEFPERLGRFFRPGQIVYDLIYTPLETSFLQAAEIRGAQTLSGIHMLIHQGARAFRIWTKKVMPLREITELLQPKLM